MYIHKTDIQAALITVAIVAAAFALAILDKVH